jgi:hypothetical protein
MTLKEKFDNVEIMFENQIGSLKYDELSEASNHCETIADDFAIEFAEWFTNEQSPYSIMNGNQEVRFSDFRKDYTIKELLEIYKKEKGL